MRPTRCVSGLYLTVADLLASLPINNNNDDNEIFHVISNCWKQKTSSQIFRGVSGVFQQDFNGTKKVLSSSRGQGNFRGLEASKPRTWPVAYAEFSKEGGGAENFGIMNTRIKIFQPKTKSVFLPKIRWRSKKKRSSLRFSPVFRPKLREGPKKGLRPPLLYSNPLPKLQRDGPCRNFAFYFMLIILCWRRKRGGPWPNGSPPKYAPGLDLRGQGLQNVSSRTPSLVASCPMFKGVLPLCKITCQISAFNVFLFVW